MVVAEIAGQVQERGGISDPFRCSGRACFVSDLAAVLWMVSSYVALVLVIFEINALT